MRAIKRLGLMAGTKGADLVHLEIRVTEYAKESVNGNYAQQYKDLDGLVKLFSSQILVKCLKFAPAETTTTATRNERGKDLMMDYRPIQYYRPPRRIPGVGLHPNIGYEDLMPGVGAGVFESRRDAAFESGEAGNVVGPKHFGWQPMPVPSPRPGAPRHDPFGPPGIRGFQPDEFGRGGGGDLQHFPRGL